ncbi:hypothetical protein SCWH03_11950 [Streptomyces pacificus]|uniref:Uncharacterized protein n=1 Tax=Streptomyces pacificus TaxID=2705029 RepID=A0A6A0ARJ5_9ACTN|nr:hypothetical protein SCWH03_11950 [Streptomyces pacificus]
MGVFSAAAGDFAGTGASADPDDDAGASGVTGADSGTGADAGADAGADTDAGAGARLLPPTGASGAACAPAFAGACGGVSWSEAVMFRERTRRAADGVRGPAVRLFA